MSPPPESARTESAAGRRAAIEFVEATGEKVLITDIEHLAAAMAGESGTAIVADAAE